jgi:hypothetical protein
LKLAFNFAHPEVRTEKPAKTLSFPEVLSSE